MLDPYAPCPCGSGKKFKWCCQPIHVDIDKAFQQDAEGQHEAALRSLDKIAAEHPDNPEVWGRKAELLFNLDKPDEAEAALDKAFAINPKYPLGHFLKGSFRLHEGEIAGALLLFRKAADLYDPAAKEILGQLYGLIFDCEMKLNNPLAARAALALALRFSPGTPELVQALESVFGPKNPNLPASARQELKFQSLAADASQEQRSAWEKALAGAGAGKLTEAADAFQRLVDANTDDKAAWYNLAVCRAWLGSNADALEAFDRFVALETDETKAAAAWALGEVLRCGQGMIEQADYVQYGAGIALADPQVFANALQKLSEAGALAGLQLNEERTILNGLVLLPPPPALTPELEAKQVSHLGAFFVLMGNVVHLWNTRDESVGKAVAILRPHFGQSTEPARVRGPVKYHDFIAEALVFPRSELSEEEYKNRLVDSFTNYFEEVWLHRPLKSLSQIPPVDAAGHPILRKKLGGVIRFLEDVAALTTVPYDFARLRRKLSLDGGAETAATQTAAPDITAMGAPELAALDAGNLSDHQLEEAFQAALKLDARDLAGKFAEGLVARPPRAERPDRYPMFNHLIQLALAQGDFTNALDRVNEGEKDDCEHNAGKRRNDYEVRRGQIQVKAGEIDQAEDAFVRLIERVPTELKYRGSAAEAMLSAKEPRRALAFAEQGLAESRKQNNRDMEQYFLELAAAAARK